MDKIGTLKMIDFTSMIHVLSYVDDLTFVALTCSDINRLIRTHFNQIKPEYLVRKCFIRDLMAANMSKHHMHEALVNLKERVPRVMSNSPSYTWQSQVSANQKFRLPHNIGRTIQSIQIVSMHRVDVDTKIYIFVGGSLTIIIGDAQIMVNANGSLELMHFLKHFTQPLCQETSILCNIDATIILTDAECDSTELLVDGCKSKYRWCTNQFTRNTVHVLPPTKPVGPVRIYLNPFVLPVEYITVHFGATNSGVNVKRFSLNVSSVSSSQTFCIPGWACKRRIHDVVYYNIPIKRLVHFNRVDEGSIDIEFEPTINTDTGPGPTQIHIGVLSCNIFEMTEGFGSNVYSM